METPILTDKNQFPTDEVIFSHIGKTKTHWINYFDYISSAHPEFGSEWRYYNDGKSWLMKVTKKGKTIHWLSIIKNAFRITFYFSDKAEQDISQSKISDELKKNFIDGKHYGKIRGITVIVKTKKDVENVKELIEVKLKFLK